jgi:DNA-binding NarL/FixJ family response regulator
LHELFVNPNHLTAAENASDFLVVGGDAPIIQVVMHDEIEQLGVCDALVSRGAVLVSSEWSDRLVNTPNLDESADLIILGSSDADRWLELETDWLCQCIGDAFHTKLLLVTTQVLEQTAFDLLGRLGASGSVLVPERRSITPDLIRTVRTVLVGQTQRDFESQENVVCERIHHAARLIDHLTPRELDVLKLLSSGLSNPEISNVLNISVRTVNNFVRMMFIKLGLSGEDKINARVSASLAWCAYNGSPLKLASPSQRS